MPEHWPAKIEPHQVRNISSFLPLFHSVPPKSKSEGGLANLSLFCHFFRRTCGLLHTPISHHNSSRRTLVKAFGAFQILVWVLLFIGKTWNRIFSPLPIVTAFKRRLSTPFLLK